MHLHRFVLLATPVLALLTAAPQARAQFAVYGMGSVGFLGKTTTTTGANTGGSAGFTAGGWTLGVYDDLAMVGPLRFGLDGRYFQQSGSNSTPYGDKLRGGLVGARVALKFPLVPFTPYLQAEGGAVGTNYGVRPDNATSAAWQINGGVDFTVFPHLDLRAEYGGGLIGGYGGGNQKLQELGGGAVVRF